MQQLKFQWDDRKNTANVKKHKVSFEEAQTVFYDPNALLIADPEHSEKENRFVLLGLSDRLRTLVVCHCYRESESVIRIISARRANKKETKTYEEKL